MASADTRHGGHSGRGMNMDCGNPIGFGARDKTVIRPPNR